MRYKFLSYVCAAAAMAGLSVECRAQDAELAHVSEVSFHDGNWTYVPIVRAAGGGPITEAILAVDRDYANAGNKIVCVWYVRNFDAPEGWDTYSWTTSDPWEAVEQLKAVYSISAEEDYLWGVTPSDSSSEEGAALAEAVPYSRGVLSDDLYAGYATNEETHDGIVELLSQLDHKVADVPLERAGACGAASKLEAISAAAEASFGSDGDTVVASEGLYQTLATGACAGTVITPISTKPMGPAGPWTTVPTCYTNNGVTVCFLTRKQNFIRKRTCATYTPAGGYSFCDQWTVISCEQDVRCVVPIAPSCMPVLPVPATPNIPLGPDDGYGTPTNCTNGGWVGNSPRGCTCP